MVKSLRLGIKPRRKPHAMGGLSRDFACLTDILVAVERTDHNVLLDRHRGERLDDLESSADADGRKSVGVSGV